MYSITSCLRTVLFKRKLWVWQRGKKNNRINFMKSYYFFKRKFHSIANTVKYLIRISLWNANMSVCSLCITKFHKVVGVLGSFNHTSFHIRDLTGLFPVHSSRNPKSHSHLEHISCTHFELALVLHCTWEGFGFLTRSGHFGVSSQTRRVAAANIQKSNFPNKSQKKKVIWQPIWIW